MLKEYTQEQFWKLYEKLPKDLQDAIFSEETANNIYTVCDRYEIDEIPKVAKIVGFILLGVLPPDELYENLVKELYIDPVVAKKVAQELIRFIFYPVRKSLEELYGIAVKKSLEEIEEQITTQKKKKPVSTATSKTSPTVTSRTKPKTTSKKNKKDLYREPVEEEEE